MKGTISCEIETITPEIAKTYLATNIDGNRSINNRNISKIKSDMENGKFKLTHQGIAFDTEGRLCDGQHRMKALSLCSAGTKVKMLVTRNLSKEDFPEIDSGKPRPEPYRMGLLNNSQQFRSTRGITLTNGLIELYGIDPFSWSIEQKDEFNKNHLGLHSYFYNLINKNRNSSGKVISIGYIQALISAVACGVPLNKIEAFNDFVNNSTIDEEIKANWNSPASFYRWYVEITSRGGGWSGSTRNNLTNEAKKSIYLFVNNTKRTTKDTFYEPTTIDLDQANIALEKININ